MHSTHRTTDRHLDPTARGGVRNSLEREPSASSVRANFNGDFFFWALAARVWRRSRACTATARVHIQVKSGPVSRSYRARCAPIVRTNRTRTNTQELDGGSKKLKHVPSQ
jgi:hypothetical protein